MFKNCSHCLPDCEETSFTSSVTSSRFRRCDYRSLGSTTVCKLFDQDVNPKSFYHLAELEFKSRGFDGVPEYSNKHLKKSNIRKLKGGTIPMFENVNKNYTYDAYEKDIAIVHFYHEKPTVVQFERSPRLTLYDFISQVRKFLIPVSIMLGKIQKGATVSLNRNKVDIKQFKTCNHNVKYLYYMVFRIVSYSESRHKNF